MKSRLSLFLLGLAYLSFISLGLPDGLNGVAWPSIRSQFNLPIDALGSLLITFTIGYLLSSFTSGRLLSRLGVGSLLALSCGATAVSLGGYAIAKDWWLMVALGLVAGLGAGAIDSGLNSYAATRFSARTVSWLHAFYGVGAAGGPLIMTVVLAAHHSWRWGYALVGIGQLLLSFCFALTRRSWLSPSGEGDRPDGSGPSRESNLSTLRLRTVWLSAAVFFVYTGTEAAAGVWAYTLFTQARAVPIMTAGAWVSFYWASLTAGRLLSGFLAGFVPSDRLLRSSMIGMAVGAAMVWMGRATPLSFAGLSLMGLASAPVFPVMISSTPMRLARQHVANAIGFQVAAAVLGQSLLPALIGVAARRMELEIVGPALLASALTLMLAYHWLSLVRPKASLELDIGCLEARTGESPSN